MPMSSQSEADRRRMLRAAVAAAWRRLRSTITMGMTSTRHATLPSMMPMAVPWLLEAFCDAGDVRAAVFVGRPKEGAEGVTIAELDPGSAVLGTEVLLESPDEAMLDEGDVKAVEVDVAAAVVPALDDKGADVPETELELEAYRELIAEEVKVYVDSELVVESDRVWEDDSSEEEAVKMEYGNDVADVSCYDVGRAYQWRSRISPTLYACVLFHVPSC
ncbi:hypothetical protein BV25DRAFT_806961 [Artomyces pyxidatus]|uniref:Uncharacterized protein n=1 Tax=Artomyces pyxidatus TaxID=48021 RepID=A0ACB8SYC6_9AGAM|nr:hypothetical protein BV25DRAFT_806961 [Artomyces pyxidatus]